MLNDAADAMKEGIRLRADGFVQDSVESFRRAVLLAGSDEVNTRNRSSMLLAEALCALGEHREGDAIYADLLRQDLLSRGVLMNTWRLRSALRLAQGRLSEAREFLANAEAVRADVWTRSEPLDLDFQTAAQHAAEGDYGSARALLTDLVEEVPDDADSLRRQGYAQLLLASIAVAEHSPMDAVQLAEQVVHAAENDPALHRLKPQAWHVLAEARLAATDYPAAETAFAQSVAACLAGNAVRPELQRIHVEARLGVAAAQRALGRVPDPDHDIGRVLADVEKLQDNHALKAKCLLVLAHSRIQSMATADEDVARDTSIPANGKTQAARDARRRALARARSALREAVLLADSVEGTERLSIQLLNTLAYVQRALGRSQQAVATLADAERLLDAPNVTATDRGDFHSGYGISQLAQVGTDHDLDGAAQSFRAAREAYCKEEGWYDVARTDQNLALVDVARADRARELGDEAEEQRCLATAIERLVPALLAKFALRFTLMSAELRRVWNEQQAQGLDVAIECALRTTHNAWLVADLVLLARVQGVLTPASASTPGRSADPTAAELQQVGRFDDRDGTRPTVNAALADLLGIPCEPRILTPPPMLHVADDHVVLDDYFAAAIGRYGEFGLAADCLRQAGAMRL